MKTKKEKSFWDRFVNTDYKDGYNKAIDDFVEKCKKKERTDDWDNHFLLFDDIEQIAKELKQNG